MLPRYFLASLVALAVDYGIYLALLRFSGSLSPAQAAAPAYIAGAVVHYFISRRFVFPEGWLHRHQLGEFALFILSGLLGAALTSAVVWAVSSIPGAGIHWPKIAAIVVSFTATYAVRKFLVFRSPDRRQAAR
jgi:putative flippase GtrA